MTLAHLQDDFIGLLRAERPPDLSPGRAVYHFAYRNRLLDCLKSVFAKTWTWLGDAGFEAAALHYIGSHPSRTWTLNVFGSSFDAILAQLYPDDAEVAELAWLEWALHSAFSGPDAIVATAEDLAIADWENGCLVMAPTLVHRPVVSNAAAIWSGVARGETPQSAAILPAPAALLVWRRAYEPQFRTVDGNEYAAVTALQAGQPFAEVCGRIQPGVHGEDPTELAGQWLGTWLSTGLVTGVK